VTPLSTGPGRLAGNVMHFGRVLRNAGVPVGSDRIQLALRALEFAGLESRNDFHAVLSACLVDRHAHQELFDQAFSLFWRDPDLAGRLRALLLPKVQSTAPLPTRENRRLGDALFPQAPEHSRPPPPAPDEIELEAALTASSDEQLRRADFETMSIDEYRAALRALARLHVVFPPLPTRRRESARRPGRVDMRATLRSAARQGGEFVAPRYSRTRELVPPLVVLADISGSMARYSRVLLHFAHLLANAHPHVESFVFGTRLTRLTPWLRGKDPDLAVARAVAGVQDWSGGTRIAECLREFNRRWARRLLGGRATVLLVSDGLEHGAAAELGFEMERLAKSARRLLWLNPLLRYSGFEPRAAGMKAMLPHVSACLPVHNLNALEQLVQVLAQTQTQTHTLTREHAPRPG
jgi:uncharacterized protein with von Willebrand factor type A (vWA) domain